MFIKIDSRKKNHQKKPWHILFKNPLFSSEICWFLKTVTRDSSNLDSWSILLTFGLTWPSVTILWPFPWQQQPKTVFKVIILAWSSSIEIHQFLAKDKIYNKRTVKHVKSAWTFNPFPENTKNSWHGLEYHFNENQEFGTC